MIDCTELRMTLYVVAFLAGMLIAVTIGRTNEEPTQAEYAELLLDTAWAELGAQ